MPRGGGECQCSECFAHSSRGIKFHSSTLMTENDNKSDGWWQPVLALRGVQRGEGGTTLLSHENASLTFKGLVFYDYTILLFRLGTTYLHLYSCFYPRRVSYKRTLFYDAAEFDKIFRAQSVHLVNNFFFLIYRAIKKRIKLCAIRCNIRRNKNNGKQIKEMEWNKINGLWCAIYGFFFVCYFKC